MSRIGRIGGKSSANSRRQSGRDADPTDRVRDRSPDGDRSMGSMSHPGDGGGHHAEAVRGTGGGDLSSEAMDAGETADDGGRNDMARNDMARNDMDRIDADRPSEEQDAGAVDVSSPS